MAYASVVQGEHDAAAVYRDSQDLTALSPSLPEISSPPLSSTFDRLSGDGALSSASQTGPDSVGVGSLLKSLSSSPSYQMVEDDDYEVPSAMPRRPEGEMGRLSMTQEEDPNTFEREDAPIRTASISRHLPLNHPTPDLQTLQGALVKNVERLEESAERLSMTSSLDEELNKMKQDQKRLERQSSAPATLDHTLRTGPVAGVQRQFSTSSWSNSIISVNQAARNGGYSPAAYITSPTGSVRSVQRHSSSKSGHRGHPLPEPPLEGRPLDLKANNPASISSLPEGEGGLRLSVASQGSIPDDRPPTSASNDTYHQAQSAFQDFDGVHFLSGLPHERDGSILRRISLKHPPLAKDSKAYREAQPGENMIYYPAPVPVMLNLPPRLSKNNLAQAEQRRLQALSGIPSEMRKSAAWLKEQDDARSLPGGKSSLDLPPQLRASAFFEQPSVTQDLQLKNGSAVQTLDSILDAAAYAPVFTFTDHPIAGHVGKEVYGPNTSPRKGVQLPDMKGKKRRGSLSNMLKTRRSSTLLSLSGLVRPKSKGPQALDADEYASGDDLDRAAAEAISPAEDEIPDANGEEEEMEEEEEEEENAAASEFAAAPTTLLAELQMRKEQQKLRNRTAADAFPNGMHSTLLELDAVTQLQQKARKTKHVTLAWEDHKEADKQNFEDEDVPLGVLFPEKDRADGFNINRPVGLLERRELEDNEPLSHRRARLRGEPLQSKAETNGQIGEQSQAPFINEVPGLSPDTLPEQEDETLGQRLARLKLEKEKGTGGEFAEELTSQLGLNTTADGQQPSKTPDVEETLAQRRQRLKEEAATTPASNSMHNLAGILQAHPVGLRSRQVSYEVKSSAMPSSRPQGPLLQFSDSARLPGAYPSQGLPSGPTTSWNNAHHNGAFNGAYGNLYPANLPYMNGAMGMSTPSFYGAPFPTNMQQFTGMYPYAYGQPYIQDPMMGPPLDPKQRATIDRWRQSVAQ